MKRPAIFIGLNIAIIIGLSVVQVVVATSIATKGIELSTIQQQIAELKKQNALLYEQVLTAEAFTTIASRASEMGFEESSNNLVFSSPVPLARR